MTFSLEAFGSERKYNRFNNPPSGSYTVRSANPYFVSPVVGATSSVVNYSFINDIGNPVSEGKERTGRVSAALDFDVGASWSGNTFLAYSRTTEKAFSRTFNSNAV